MSKKPKGKKKIVVVDDLQLNLIIAQKYIETTDDLKMYDVVPFQDSEKALDYCSRNSDNIEIILLDQTMPGLSGTDFLQIYNEVVPYDKKAAIIMISSLESNKLVAEALDKGVDDFFPKPFDPLTMRARIINSISKNKLRREMSEEKMLNQILLRTLIHDISNPLTVGGFFLDKHKEGNQDLLKASKSLESVQEVITSIKTILALESNKLAQSQEEIKVQELLASLYESFYDQAKKKGVILDIDNRLPEGAIIHSDNKILRYQIFSNLITNSIKFTHAGEKVTLFADKAQNVLIVGVKDEGIGIPEDILKNLFRWDKKTTRKGTNNEQGTGFGMPIVMKFVEDLGHQIVVLNNADPENGGEKGTTIQVTF